MKIVLNDENVRNDYGFKIRNSGIDLTRFKNNPVLLYNHKDWSLPIGKLTNLAIEGNLLVGEIEFDKEDTNEDVKAIIGKYERGFMTAFSMGIMINTIIDASFPNGEDFIATQSELYELSCVTIPSNKNAVKLMNKEGLTMQSPKGDLVQLSFNDGKLNFLTQNKGISEMKEVIKALGLAETATELDCVSAITKLKSKSETLEKQQVESLVTLGKNKGIVTAQNEASFRILLTSNYDAAKSIIDGAEAPKAAEEPKPEPKPTPTEGATNLTSALASITGGNNGGKEEGKDDRSKWNLSDWQKKDSEGLRQLKRNDNAAFMKLVSDYEKTVKVD